MPTTGYEAIDAKMSSWVVACLRDGVTMFITPDGLGTDMPTRASCFRWLDDAEKAAEQARSEYAWQSFAWQPMLYAEAVANH